MSLFKKQFSSGLLAISMLLASPMIQSEVIFEENFDAQPDWTGATDPSPSTSSERLPSRGDLIPKNWDFARVDPVWAPSTGYPGKHESLEILASNTDKTRTGSGKSMVCWRDSYDNGSGYWGSESLLLKRIGDQSEVYVEFWITFSPEMYATFARGKMGTAKIFRIYSFKGDWGYPFRYFDGVAHPNLIWDLYGSPPLGIRNKLALLGINSAVGAPDMPQAPNNPGDWSLSYLTSLDGQGPNGTDVLLPDRKNGGLIDPAIYSAAQMDQVFGPPGSWTKVAFHVKMNSAPGVNDGILSQYINDLRILHTDTVSWRNSVNGAEFWNVVGISGNDYFVGYPNEDRREEWYAIDDIKVMSKLPDDLAGNSGSNAPPNPPLDISID